MIPETIDVLTLLSDLNRCGWRDYKIEIECEFAKGYISALKARRVKNPHYTATARLFNLHERLKLSPSSPAILCEC